MLPLWLLCWCVLQLRHLPVCDVPRCQQHNGPGWNWQQDQTEWVLFAFVTESWSPWIFILLVFIPRTPTISACLSQTQHFFRFFFPKWHFLFAQEMGNGQISNPWGWKYMENFLKTFVFFSYMRFLVFLFTFDQTQTQSAGLTLRLWWWWMRMGKRRSKRKWWIPVRSVPSHATLAKLVFPNLMSVAWSLPTTRRPGFATRIGFLLLVPLTQSPQP